MLSCKTRLSAFQLVELLIVEKWSHGSIKTFRSKSTFDAYLLFCISIDKVQSIITCSGEQIDETFMWAARRVETGLHRANEGFILFSQLLNKWPESKKCGFWLYNKATANKQLTFSVILMKTWLSYFIMPQWFAVVWWLLCKNRKALRLNHKLP